MSTTVSPLQPTPKYVAGAAAATVAGGGLFAAYNALDSIRHGQKASPRAALFLGAMGAAGGAAGYLAHRDPARGITLADGAIAAGAGMVAGAAVGKAMVPSLGWKQVAVNAAVGGVFGLLGGHVGVATSRWVN